MGRLFLCLMCTLSHPNTCKMGDGVVISNSFNTLEFVLEFNAHVEELVISKDLYQGLAPHARSTVSGNHADPREEELKSNIVPKDIMQRYTSANDKLRKELKLSSLEDHRWNLRSWDQSGAGVVKLYCVECFKDFGPASSDQTETTIQNLFANLKKSHIMSNIHVRN